MAAKAHRWQTPATPGANQSESQMQGYVSMRESKAEPISRLVKLVDAVHHCSQLFAAAAAKTDVDPLFQ